MTVELNDEVTVPHFEDKLWHELARVHEQERIEPSPADVHLGFPAARRPVRAGLALIAAATIAIAGIVVTRSNDRPADALQARIIAATETALADSIVYSVTDFGDRGGRDEHWFDETTGMSRLLSYAENGELAREFTLAPTQGDRPPPTPSWTTAPRSTPSRRSLSSLREVRTWPQGSWNHSATGLCRSTAPKWWTDAS
jgi:hypothetical protein